jgi:1-deoxy-D-xylulose-5-phosphate reductoisomerase
LKGIAILGATGSIGRSALAVLDQHPDRFRAVALTAARRGDELAALAERYRPALAVLAEGGVPAGAGGGTEWRTGREALLAAATHPDADVVINAVVGAAGLEPTLAALRAGKRVALANKSRWCAAGRSCWRRRARAAASCFPWTASTAPSSSASRAARPRPCGGWC